ncbi:MAG: tetratricopeptide repeat protein [bacterium]|nr:tetratricopeptide repeat protein [bacterium]
MMQRAYRAGGTPALTILLALAVFATCPVAVSAQDSTGSDPELGRDQQPEPSDAERIAELDQRLAGNPADHQGWNDLGVIYANQDRFDLARDSFIRAIQANPRYGDYHRNLGMAFSRLDDHDMAIAEFRAYQRFDELGGHDFWRLIGGAQARAGLLDEARATYREGLAGSDYGLGPEGLRLVLALNKLEHEAGEEDAVRKLLAQYTKQARSFRDRTGPQDDGHREAAAIVHNQVTQHVDDAKLLETSGLDLDAAAEYEAAYEMMPDRDDLLPRIVDVYLRADESMKARVAARLARDEHPDRAGTWIATAKVHEKTARLDDAVIAYGKAYEIDPEFPDLRLAIGNLLMRLGRDDEAAEYLKAGVTSADTKPEVVYNYAVSQIREKKYHAAIASLRKVVKERPDMAPAWIALAQCLRVTKQYGAAVDPYEHALELQPESKLAYNLGICARKSGRVSTAVKAYGKALELDPTMIEARYNLSLSLMDAERYEEAVVSFTAMADLEPESYRVYYSQGLAYYYLGRWDEALDAYDHAASIEETPAVYNNMGLVYDKLGQKKQAEKLYKRAKEL